MKTKVVSFIYAFISVCVCICIYYLEANVDLAMLGYYGNTKNIAALLSISLIPIFFCIFLLSFYKNKIISVISSLSICFLYVLRITAFIKNMSNLKLVDKLTTGRMLFYSALCIVFVLLALCFLMLSLSKEIQLKALPIMKISMIVSIVVFGLAALLFMFGAVVMSDEIEMKRFCIAVFIVYLLDVINYVLMLVSTKNINKALEN